MNASEYNYKELFPSPLGVSYFQIEYWNEFYAWIDRFPSPLGVSYFQIHVTKAGNNIIDGFRPLSGYLISKSIAKMSRANALALFPSPLGVSYFQILPARARYFTGFSDSFAWQIIFLYIFLISNIHNRLQMQYLCGARQNYLFF